MLATANCMAVAWMSSLKFNDVTNIYRPRRMGEAMRWTRDIYKGQSIALAVNTIHNYEPTRLNEQVLA